MKKTDWWRGGQFLVYGLVDPQTKGIRYVGRSCKGMRRARMSAKETYAHKGNWILSLQRIGLAPEIVVLQVCNDLEDLLVAEMRWIAQLRGTGLLTNISEGGRDQRPFPCGNANPSKKPRNRFKAAQRARARQAPREQLAAEARERWRDPEYRERVTAAIRARNEDSQYKLRLGEALRRSSKHRVSVSCKAVIARRGSETQVYPSCVRAAEDLGAQRSNVCKVLKGQRSHAAGWRFQYIEDSP